MAYPHLLLPSKRSSDRTGKGVTFLLTLEMTWISNRLDLPRDGLTRLRSAIFIIWIPVNAPSNLPVATFHENPMYCRCDLK